MKIVWWSVFPAARSWSGMPYPKQRIRRCVKQGLLLCLQQVIGRIAQERQYIFSPSRPLRGLHDDDATMGASFAPGYTEILR